MYAIFLTLEQLQVRADSELVPLARDTRQQPDDWEHSNTYQGTTYGLPSSLISSLGHIL